MTRHTSGIYLHLYMEVIAKIRTVATLSGVLSYENVNRVYTEDEFILCTLLMIKVNTFFLIKSQQHRCYKGIVYVSKNIVFMGFLIAFLNCKILYLDSP